MPENRLSSSPLYTPRPSLSACYADSSECGSECRCAGSAFHGSTAIAVRQPQRCVVMCLRSDGQPLCTPRHRLAEASHRQPVLLRALAGPRSPVMLRPRGALLRTAVRLHESLAGALHQRCDQFRRSHRGHSHAFLSITTWGRAIQRQTISHTLRVTPSWLRRYGAKSDKELNTWG